MNMAHTLNSVLLGNLGSFFRALGVALIPHSHIGAGLCETMSDSKTDTSTGSCHNGSLSLEREHAHQAGVLGSSGIVVDKEPILGNWICCHYDKKAISELGLGGYKRTRCITKRASPLYRTQEGGSLNIPQKETVSDALAGKIGPGFQP
jgi:hypothetical protein